MWNVSFTHYSPYKFSPLQLCYTTGHDLDIVKDYTCPSVLPGRFVTIQKYARVEPAEWVLSVTDVRVTACT